LLAGAADPGQVLLSFFIWR